jgi:hypothetical protein
MEAANRRKKNENGEIREEHLATEEQQLPPAKERLWPRRRCAMRERL